MWYTGDKDDDDDDFTITSDEERNLINEIGDDDAENMNDEIKGEQLEVYRSLLSVYLLFFLVNFNTQHINVLLLTEILPILLNLSLRKQNN